MIRQFVSIYFLFIDFPLAFPGLYLIIAALRNIATDIEGIIFGAPDGQQLGLPSYLTGLACAFGLFLNLVMGYALVIGYLIEAIKIPWSARSAYRFWWASFIYNVFESILNIVFLRYVFVGWFYFATIIIPVVGAVLSFLCLYKDTDR